MVLTLVRNLFGNVVKPVRLFYFEESVRGCGPHGGYIDFDQCFSKTEQWGEQRGGPKGEEPVVMGRGVAEPPRCP